MPPLPHNNDDPVSYNEYTNPPKTGPTMKANVDAASFHARYFDNFPLLVPSLPLSARYALLIGEFPAKQPVSTLAAKNCSNVQHCLIPKLCNNSPIPDPNNVTLITNLRPNISLSVGHRKTPKNIPSGYADDRDPKDAPRGKLKCCPNAGWMGDAIVKPSRFRKEAINIAGMDRSLFLIVDSSFLDSLLTLLLLLLSELLSAVAESLDV